MRSPHQKKYEELSEQYGVPVHIVKSIVESQFAFTASVLQCGNDEQIRLQFLGTFSVPNGRRQKIDEKKLLAKKMRDEKEKNRQKE